MILTIILVPWGVDSGVRLQGNVVARLYTNESTCIGDVSASDAIFWCWESNLCTQNILG